MTAIDLLNSPTLSPCVASPSSPTALNTPCRTPTLTNSSHSLLTPLSSSQHATTSHSPISTIPVSLPPLPRLPSHRAKAGIFKPKVLLSTTQHNWALTEPTRINDALSTPVWKEAMDTEFSALLRNNT